MLANLNNLKRNAFRWLVLAVFLSIVYDLLWFFLRKSEINSKGEITGSFAVWMTFFSFLIRIVMGAVYWKDSLDFDNIMLHQKVETAIRTIFNRNLEAANPRAAV